MRVFVLVNALQGVNSFVYNNHIEFFVYSAKNIPNLEFRFWVPHRMSIDHARNQAAIYAKQTECDYLMFIDDDVMIPRDTLVKLLAADKDIVAGLVIIRGYPFNVMAFKWNGEKSLGYYNDLPKEPDGSLTKLIECDAVGFSCCLIKIDVLKAIEPPYFLTMKYQTEDVYFCLKVSELEPKPSIYMDTTVKCGHFLNAETIEYDTRQKFKDFYSFAYEEIPDKGRDEQYIKDCLAAAVKQ